MAAYALLVGTTNGNRKLLADGDPREVRRLFKTSDGEGFDRLEVIETGVGRSRSRWFKKGVAKSATAKTKPEPEPEPKPETQAEPQPKRRGRPPKNSA